MNNDHDYSKNEGAGWGRAYTDRTAMMKSLLRVVPVVDEMFRANIPHESLPECGERESFRQIFSVTKHQERQRRLAVNWILQHRNCHE